MPVLTVRPCGGPAEHAALVRLWRRAVDATHGFVAAADLDDIEALLRPGARGAHPGGLSAT